MDINDDINHNSSTDSFSPNDGADLSASSTSNSSRKSPFLGFTDNSQQDQHLIKALTINNPFKAGYGEKGATWDRVLQYLQAIDDVATAHGQSPLFQGITVKACRTRWDALFAKHQKRIEAVLEKTGCVPIETQHDQRIDNLYSDQVEHDKTKSASKDANEKKHKRQQDNRVMGAALRSASLNMACYRSSSSVIEDEGSISSASSTSTPVGPSASLSNPTTKSRFESDYRKRKRVADDIAKMRNKIIEDDIQRHKEVEVKRQEQHDALTKMVSEGNHELVNTIRTSNEDMVKILKDINASQKQAFDTLTLLLQKLVEK
ncbi:hypothetical protein EC957_007285 [Mortierella hygrophila]|uniref:Uncharacterized protein n=1 Tax=Mortierella hygrophila TaxID=979708 RepID=A0A9P6JY55_9FUNG|nr:hypothetical protein EC957_007285 [Mortierella hygrophila]